MAKKCVSPYSHKEKERERVTERLGKKWIRQKRVDGFIDVSDFLSPGSVVSQIVLIFLKAENDMNSISNSAGNI